jgi:ABC-type branched-subunit amino acid transport system permease subunit
MARIGTDEWVAQAEARTEADGGLVARARRRFEQIPIALRFAPFVVFVALIPAMTSSDYIVRVAVDTVVFALLAMGLNVTVGWTGLLDLGYAAFMGFGAYAYAFVSSSRFGLHWPTLATIAVVTIATGVLGLLVGLPSRRLVGDYLAIVTLFFGQLFVTVAIATSWSGGPNGIPDVDPMSFFGVELESVRGYLYVALGFFVVVALALYAVDNSRTGRAWRSIREDELAAELMTTPTVPLKLLAFVFGAAIAGLCGTISAAVVTGVFPQDFDLPLVITIYTMVILGGAGSLAGVVLGAVVVNVSLEALRTPDQARWIFYGAIALILVGFVRPWWRVAVIVVGTVVFGIVCFQIAQAITPASSSGEVAGGWLGNVLDGWVIHPESSERVGKFAYVGLIAGVILLSQIRDTRFRTFGAIPVLYLAFVAWENVLVENPSVTRYILLGVLLVVLMARRPEGLLGQKRVEVV